MEFKDLLPLFSSSDPVKLFQYKLFSEKKLPFLQAFYSRWDDAEESTRPKSLANLVTKQPKRLGKNYENLLALLEENYESWCRHLSGLLADIPAQKADAFFAQAVSVICRAPETPESLCTALERLCGQQRQEARTSLLAILVLYAILGGEMFVKRCKWTYQISSADAAPPAPDIQKQAAPEAERLPLREPAYRRQTLHPNVHYCGYEDELITAIGTLEQYHILFLFGIGGIGKTQLASRIAQHYREENRRVIVLTYETTLSENFASDDFCAEGVSRIYHDGIPESDEELAARKLSRFIRQTDANTLLVVDNFDTQYDAMLEALVAGAYSSYTLLVTTRNDFSQIGVPTLELHGLSDAAQEALFREYYPRKLSAEETAALLPRLLKLLCGHPLAIELIAKLMQRRGISFQRMIRILSKEGITPELQGDVPYGFEPAESVYKNIRRVFRLDALSAAEIEILKNMTLIPVKGTAPALFAELCGLSDTEPLMQLHDRSWLLYDAEENLIALHPLISDVIIGECCRKMDDTEQFLLRFTEKIENTWVSDLQEKQVLFGITQRILQRFPEVQVKYLPLYTNMALLSVRMEAFEHSRGLLESCLRFTVQEYGEASAQAAEIYCIIADQFLYIGDIVKAEEYISKAVEIANAVAPDALRTAYYLKYHAWTLISDPRPELLPSVKALLQKAQSILEQFPEQNDPICAEQWASLKTAYAYYYYYTEDYERALQNAEEAYAFYLRKYGEINADTVSPLAVKALIDSRLHKPEEALALIQEVIRIQKMLFPPHHQKIALRYQLLADIYYNIGDLQNAVSTIAFVCSELADNAGEGNTIYRNAARRLEDWKREAGE